jgi:hypothetical protein
LSSLGRPFYNIVRVFQGENRAIFIGGCWCAILHLGALLRTNRPDLPITATVLYSAQHFICALRDNTTLSFSRGADL